jgi:hypothetical protein
MTLLMSPNQALPQTADRAAEMKDELSRIT